MTADLTLSGTLADPLFSGQAEIWSREGVLGLFNLPFHGLVAQLKFEESSIVVEHLSASSGGGKATGSGRMTWRAFLPESLDLVFTFDRVEWSPEPNFSGRGSGEFRVEGVFPRVLVTGDLEVEESNLVFRLGVQSQDDRPG